VRKHLHFQGVPSSFGSGLPATRTCDRSQRRPKQPSSQPPDLPREGLPPSLRQGSTVSHQPHPSALPAKPRVGRAGHPPLLPSPRCNVSPCPSCPLLLYPQHLTVASSCEELQVRLLHRSMSSIRAQLLPNCLPFTSLSSTMLASPSHIVHFAGQWTSTLDPCLGREIQGYREGGSHTPMAR
jgi:hypothetical protein